MRRKLIFFVLFHAAPVCMLINDVPLSCVIGSGRAETVKKNEITEKKSVDKTPSTVKKPSVEKNPSIEKKRSGEKVPSTGKKSSEGDEKTEKNNSSDKKKDDNDDSDDGDDEDETEMPEWKVKGYFRAEGFYREEKKLEERLDETEEERRQREEENESVIKQEVKTRLDLKYGKDLLYGKTVVNIFYFEMLSQNPYLETQERKNAHAEIRELYIASSIKDYEFRFGRQIFKWGTADVFNPTSFMNPESQCEPFVQEEDESKIGVFAFYVKKSLEEDRFIELILKPNFSQPVFAPADSYWYVDLPSIPISQITGRPGDSDITVTRVQEDEKSGRAKYYSGAIRFGGTVKGLDYVFSYFNGIDKNGVFEPVLYSRLREGGVTGATTVPQVDVPDFLIDLIPEDQIPDTPVAEVLITDDPDTILQAMNLLSSDDGSQIEIETVINYLPIQKYGLELAFTAGKMSVRLEFAYTVNQPLWQKINSISAPEKKQVGYMEWVVGFDYPLDGKNLKFLAEYYHGGAVRRASDYYEPTFNELAVIRLEDKFFHEKIIASIDYLIEFDAGKKVGYMQKIRLNYDFKNSLTVEIGYYFFLGDPYSMMSMMEEKNMGYLRVKYTF